MYIAKIYAAVTVGVVYYFYHYLFGNTARNKLIFILIDGIGSDFLSNQDLASLPGLHKLYQNGTHSRYLNPVYPSLHYPQSTTLVTGLWPESHGIVGNYFYDARNKDSFNWLDFESVSKQKWWVAEAIGITATKARLVAGILNWGQCRVEFEGVTPAFCLPYKREKQRDSFQANTELAASLLRLNYDFIQIYEGHFEETQRTYGVDSTEVKQALKNIDAAITHLLDTIEEIDLSNKVNIILVGGHGMQSRNNIKNVINLEGYLNQELVESIAGFETFVNIKVRDGELNKVKASLNKIEGVNVFSHDDIPEVYHLKKSEFIYDVIVEAMDGTYILPSKFSNQIPQISTSIKGLPMAASGYYHKTSPAMRTIFFAYGPDFRKGFSLPPVESVDVYPLLTYLLQVDPQPNNGSFETIKLSLEAFSPDSKESNGGATNEYEEESFESSYTAELEGTIYDGEVSDINQIKEHGNTVLGNGKDFDEPFYPQDEPLSSDDDISDEDISGEDNDLSSSQDIKPIHPILTPSTDTKIVYEENTSQGNQDLHPIPPILLPSNETKLNITLNQTESDDQNIQPVPPNLSLNDTHSIDASDVTPPNNVNIAQDGVTTNAETSSVEEDEATNENMIDIDDILYDAFIDREDEVSEKEDDIKAESDDKSSPDQGLSSPGANTISGDINIAISLHEKAPLLLNLILLVVICFF